MAVGTMSLGYRFEVYPLRSWRRRRQPGFACGKRGRRLQFMAIVLFQIRDEGSHIAIHMRAFAQACPVNQRKGRLFERRPTFAQEVALCLDEYSLYLGARLFCHERESALESV